MSDSESGGEGAQDFQLGFVELLKKFDILFDKKMTPTIKSEKERALKSLTAEFNFNTDKNLDTKQVLKKCNNMKMKVKKLTDLKRTGNRKIILKEWQKIFYAMWNAGENPVLQKIPGAANAGLAQSSIETEAADVRSSPKKPRLACSQNSETLQDLQKRCLLKQIEAAEAQQRAALAQEHAANAIEQFVETWFREKFHNPD